MKLGSSNQASRRGALVRALSLVALTLTFASCGDGEQPAFGPRRRLAEGPLPVPDLFVLRAAGLRPEWLVTAGGGAQRRPSLAALTAAGTTLENHFAVELDGDRSAAAFWEGAWPHAEPERRDPQTSAFATELKRGGYQLVPRGAGDAVERVRVWLGSDPRNGGARSAAEADVGAPRALLVELDERDESAAETLEELASLLAPVLRGAVESAARGGERLGAAGRDGGANGGALGGVRPRLVVWLGASAGSELRGDDLRAPALVAWPGVVPANTSRPQLVTELDLRATVLDLIGLGAGPGSQDASGALEAGSDVDARAPAGGRAARAGAPAVPGATSFADLLRRRRQAWRGHVCAESWGEPERVWLRTAQWTLVWSRGQLPSVFALETDPEERVDLGGRAEVASVQRQLAGVLEDWMAAVELD